MVMPLIIALEKVEVFLSWVRKRREEKRDFAHPKAARTLIIIFPIREAQGWRNEGIPPEDAGEWVRKRVAMEESRRQLGRGSGGRGDKALKKKKKKRLTSLDAIRSRNPCVR